MCYVILVLVESTSSEGSDEPAQMSSLIRALAALTHKVDSKMKAQAKI